MTITITIEETATATLQSLDVDELQSIVIEAMDISAQCAGDDVTSQMNGDNNETVSVLTLLVTVPDATVLDKDIIERQVEEGIAGEYGENSGHVVEVEVRESEQDTTTRAPVQVIQRGDTDVSILIIVVVVCVLLCVFCVFACLLCRRSKRTRKAFETSHGHMVSGSTPGSPGSASCASPTSRTEMVRERRDTNADPGLQIGVSVGVGVQASKVETDERKEAEQAAWNRQESMYAHMEQETPGDV